VPLKIPFTLLVVSFKKSDKKLVVPNLTLNPSLVANASNKVPFQKPVR
jgi:hypothetical protein